MTHFLNELGRSWLDHFPGSRRPAEKCRDQALTLTYLFQVSPRVAPKPKPVAKIVAKTKRSSRDFTPTSDIIKLQDGDDIDAYKSTNTNSLDRRLDRKSSSKYDSGKKGDKIYDTPATTLQGGTDVRKPLYISTSHSSHSGSGFAPGGSGSLPGSPQSPATGQYVTGSPGSGGSPTGKKAPPPPPKRTNSIKSDHHPPMLRKSHHQSGKSNGNGEDTRNSSITQQQPPPPPTKDSTPPRPPLPQNYVSSNVPRAPQQPPHSQQQPPNGGGDGTGFQDCVKSLSERFERSGGNSGQGEAGVGNSGVRRGSSGSSTSLSSLASVPDPPHYTPSQNEDFPPPPPPLSNAPSDRTTATSAQHRDSHSNPLSDVIDQLQGRSGAGGAASQHNHPAVRQGAQTPDWGLNDSDESDSDSGFESRKSGSSIGSAACPTGSTDTLPFANENVGTIKSRSQNSKPSIVTVTGGDGEGDEGERTVDLDTSFFQDSGTIKRKPKSDQPAPPQDGAAQRPVKQGELTASAFSYNGLHF